MPLEKSAGALIFHEPRISEQSSVRGKNQGTEYLLLHYPPGVKASKEYWDLPKGHIERGEKEIDTVKREVREETGLEDIEIIEGFKEDIQYFFKFKGQTIFKIVTFYLARTKTRDVKISFEHIDYKWLPYEKALEQLTFKNAKDILRKAQQLLENKK